MSQSPAGRASAWQAGGQPGRRASRRADGQAGLRASKQAGERAWQAATAEDQMPDNVPYSHTWSWPNGVHETAIT